MRLWFRAQGMLRQHSQLVRRPARALKRRLAIARHRWRTRRGQLPGPRVVTSPAPLTDRSAQHPAINVVIPEVVDRVAVERFLAGQTEASVVVGGTAPYCWVSDGCLDHLPATHLESLLLSVAVEDLEWVVAGWSAPAGGRYGPTGALARHPDTGDAACCLLRTPTPDRAASAAVQGRTVAHITGEAQLAGCVPITPPSTNACGPHYLRSTVEPGAVVTHPVYPAEAALAALPAIPGPRTALFLLPFVAVGGAERLLFDLLEGLGGRHRILVATTEPHQEALGQAVDECRGLTPHVYTLGDWLPREALDGALRHLIRRWQVECLVSWNGTTWFYDHAATLGHDHPGLRLVNQLFNHSGGWIRHYSPGLVDAVETHVAVNDRIAHALEHDRGVAPEGIATVHHAVRVPPAPTPEECASRRRRRREQLGLPQDRVVVGTFARMHAQKRPLDVIRLARSMKGVHFLLVGGGPLDAAVDHELAASPTPNLTRLPMRRDTAELFDAVDVCLLNSNYEGLPVFLLEGLARSIPCVATAVGEVPELLAHGGGVVVQRPGDLTALAAAVDSLLDESTRAAEGARGRATVIARFGLERYTNELEEIIFPGPAAP